LILVLLLTSVFTLSSSFQPARGFLQTIYIRADGSIEPVAAPIQRDGDLYTLTGNISTNGVVIEKDNIILDGNNYTIDGTGTIGCIGLDLYGRVQVVIKNMRIRAFSDSIVLSYSSSITIERNSIGEQYQGRGYGIGLIGSSNNVICGNYIADTDYAVYLGASYNGSISSNNRVSGNKIVGNSNGVYLEGSVNNSIYQNILNDNSLGVHFENSANNSMHGNELRNYVSEGRSGISLNRSPNNMISNNSLANHEYGWHIAGSNLSDYINIVDTLNTVDGKPVYYWVSRENLTVPAEAGFVVLVNCTEMLITNLNISGQNEGILLAYTTNSTIAENTITSSYYGVLLTDSLNNEISRNSVADNYRYGIWLTNSSNNNIERNSIIQNGYAGVMLEDSSGNGLKWNSVEGSLDGIVLVDSPYSIVNWNNVAGCSVACNRYGIKLSGSPACSVRGNNVTKNGSGILIGSNDTVSGNLISENNDRGLRVGGSNSFIRGNLFRGNINYGIDLEYCGTGGNTIMENNITGSLAGIWIQYSNDSNVARNNMTENASFGVWIGFSSNSTVHENFIKGSQVGTGLHKSNDSFIHHNDIVDCFWPAGIENSTSSVWDDGYPSGGNYWSDFSERYPDVQDVYSGPNRDRPGSDGIWDKPYVINNPVGTQEHQDNYPLTYPFTGHYTYMTNFTLREVSSLKSTMYESISLSRWIIQNATVSGDFSGSVNMTTLACLKIETGPFANQGLIKCNWSSEVENTEFGGTWEVVQFCNVSNGDFVLRGVVSGDFQGIATGTIQESVPGSGVFDSFHAVWKLNRIYSVLVSACIKLNGTIEFLDQNVLSNVELLLSQTIMNGSADGYYSGPLSGALTEVRIMNGSITCAGDGLSVVSYDSQLGGGEGWTTEETLSLGGAGLRGMFQDPLSGVVFATLTNNVTLSTLTGTIAGVLDSSAGFELRADLNVRAWGPLNVSPGQTVEYLIEYRNTGLKAADEAVVFAIPYSGKLVSASEGGEYDEIFHTVSWNLGELPPRTRGLLSFRVEIPRGLPLGTTLGVPVYMINNEKEQAPLPECPSARNLFINGILLSPEGTSPKYEEFARSQKAEWAKVYNTGRLKDDIAQVQKATPGIAYEPTEINGLTNPTIVNPNCTYDTVYAYSGGTRTALTAILNFNLRCKKLVLISPIAGFNLLPRYKDELASALSPSYGVEKIEIYQSYHDNLLAGGLYQAYFNPADPWLKGKNIQVHEVPLPGFPKACYLLPPSPFCGVIAHLQLFWEMNKVLNGGVSFVTNSTVLVAADPNAKYGPNRYVLAGETLEYTVEYENEGEGTAFGVYITDTLDESLDASTLAIVDDGRYDPSTRTITWLIGEVGPHQNGSVTFSVDVRDGIPEGTEIMNFATVHFPSVPETTRTNGIVNVVAYEHDVSVLSVTPFEVYVENGTTVLIDVRVENQGVNFEAFNVSVYADLTLIQTRTVNLITGNHTTVTFYWNTTGFALGNYYISAYAEPVSGEEDTTDNTLKTGTPIEVVPEFPSLAILPLLILVTLSAIVFSKRKEHAKQSIEYATSIDR
jgi:uncharacterized repeat protein (TIGR01451 family)